MNRSLPPSSGVMNPYPFASLNHFTVPVAIKTPPLPFHERARKAHCLTELALFLVHASRFFDRLLAGSPRSGGRLLRLPLQRALLLDPAFALQLRHRRLSLAPQYASLVRASSLPGAGRPALRRGLLELLDHELPHAQHRLHDTLGLLRVRLLEQARKRRRDDLPGDSEPVPQPPTGALLAALGERFPIAVDLLLGLAEHLEGDRLAEGELRAGVEGDELLPHQLERDGHDGPLVPRAGGAVAGDLPEVGVREDRRVELRGILPLRVEPETGHQLVCHLAVLSC